MASNSQIESGSARVTFVNGNGGLPMLEIQTRWSTAQIYLHGAHVTHFQKRDEPPLLFLSRESRFQNGQPIRGGIPVIFPWFGPREGAALHGFARVKPWELASLDLDSDGGIRASFRFPGGPEASAYPPFTAEYMVIVREQLRLELAVTNRSSDQPLSFEGCLHTYFAAGDISSTAISGLKGTSYLDKTANFARKEETDDAIRISSEVDRVYLDARGAVEIRDETLGRVIGIAKENSASTVVWNPWIAKARQMPDFGDEEYKSMVCVESGNVGPNQVTLPPGATSRMKVTISSRRL